VYLQILKKYRSGLQSSFWHNTKKQDRDIQLWKDPLLRLDYTNFWSQDHLFQPYIVRAATEDAIRNHQTCLTSCAARIERERTAERAREIMTALHNVLNDMRVEKVNMTCTFSCIMIFNWPTSNPHFKWPCYILLRVQLTCVCFGMLVSGTQVSLGQDFVPKPTSKGSCRFWGSARRKGTCWGCMPRQGPKEIASRAWCPHRALATSSRNCTICNP
jgi:hypothetical protein